MPRKKKEPVAEEKSECAKPLKIENMYEKIPKELLDNADNPNFDLHKLKLPFRMCVVAPSGSGKTNFVLNLISIFSRGRGSFASVDIITRNKDEPLYKWLVLKCDQINIKEGMESIPPLDKMDKEINHLVIFDDLVLAKDQSRIENYYIRARKLNCSVIYLSQSYYRIPKIIRSNCNYMCILKLSGNREVKMILSEFGLGVSKEELLRLYTEATAEKFQPLIIDLDEEPPKRFRKGLTEIMTVNPENK
jgi:hypothetical protein